jgi:hypothetical protein
MISVSSKVLPQRGSKSKTICSAVQKVYQVIPVVLFQHALSEVTAIAKLGIGF